MQAGWQTGASAIPSTLLDPSVEEVCWECALCTALLIRRATLYQNQDMMLSVTQVHTLGFIVYFLLKEVFYGFAVFWLSVANCDT